MVHRALGGGKYGFTIVSFQFCTMTFVIAYLYTQKEVEMGICKQWQQGGQIVKGSAVVCE